MTPIVTLDGTVTISSCGSPSFKTTLSAVVELTVMLDGLGVPKVKTTSVGNNRVIVLVPDTSRPSIPVVKSY